jgi:CHAT domain-containing protein
MQIGAKTVDDASRQDLDTFVANLRRKEPDELYFDVSRGLGLRISSLLPHELIQEAIAGKRLLVAPHRELHVVPWAAMELDDTRVCARTAVGIVPCLSCVPALGVGLSQKPSVQFFGPPAYRSADDAMDDYQRELDTIAASFVQSGTSRSRGPNQQGATVSAFLELLDDKKSPDTMLLVASHGEFDPGEPLRSKLNVADGSVDAATMILHRIAFEEVLLRACSTGERVERVGALDLIGDDILGIPGALLEAGARSVMVSIPPLVRRPTTRRLFERFLARRNEGDPPLLALADAQRAALEDGDDAVDWAGVAVYGVQ